MAYASITDVQARMTAQLTSDQTRVCTALLDDAAVLIDAFALGASYEAKTAVSCSMVIRALGSAAEMGVPVGASQGSMSALGYSQSWTMGATGSTGELYLNRMDKKLLGAGNAIGSYSPIQELVPQQEVES